MDARRIEAYVEQRLKKLLGTEVTITRGPDRFPVLGGLRPEVFVHAQSLEDFGGVTADGAHTARQPWRGPSNLRGYVEDRPGRLVFRVTCVTGSHDNTQTLSGLVMPAVLLAFELSPPFTLGAIDGGAASVTLVDYLPVLHETRSEQLREDDLVCFRTRLVFHLDGAIRVVVSRRRGLSRPQPRVSDRTPSRPAPVKSGTRKLTAKRKSTKKAGTKKAGAKKASTKKAGTR
jgi:hypothetical protein